MLDGLMEERASTRNEPSDTPATSTGAPANDVNKHEESWPAGMKIVNDDQARSIRAQGMLQSPNDFGYIHLAAEIERPRVLGGHSQRKTSAIEAAKKAAATLARDPRVNRADVFSAIMIPPGSKEGREVVERGGHDVHIAEFDLVILVECPTPALAREVRETEAFQRLHDVVRAAASFVHCVTATNPKRIAEVDRTRQGVFLFNYFFAANVESKGASGIEVLLGVWEYTAGWWTAKANLTNSTPLLPMDGEESSYSLINHCRWDRLSDVLPSLIFRPTLNSFVLGNFTANDIMAMPILYRLV